MKYSRFYLTGILSFFFQIILAQPSSLLWEISGNGLSRPSYLFGTMHVSDKLAFNLNDSLYEALRRVDMVCLEINPEIWQTDQERMEHMKFSLNQYTSLKGQDYLNEQSLRLKDYYDQLRFSLQYQPYMINHLLYRNRFRREDFQEDSYLDLYLYQCGRKMGKKGGGLENYRRSEMMQLEAMLAAINEKKLGEFNEDFEYTPNLLKMLEDAYRRGDLDELDSLNRISMPSKAYTDIFIDQRNEIQAKAIDSLLKTQSVFAAVGAAHLSGKKGVIQYLRNSGYILRPVMVKGEPDRKKKEALDNLVVPTEWENVVSHDGLISVDMPGPWYSLNPSRGEEFMWQHADMSNGAYFTFNRVLTYGAFRHLSPEEILRRADSLIYENVPGKLLDKSVIPGQPFPCLEVNTRSRRGDLLRLRLYVTPHEVLILRISGPVSYMQSGAPERFFGSVQFHPSMTQEMYQPEWGGFRVPLPGIRRFRNNGSITPDRMECMSYDSATGTACLLLRTDLYQFEFLGEDSIDLRLMEASFMEEETAGRLLDRHFRIYQGYPALQVKEMMPDSSMRQTVFLLKGPHYYVWSVRSAAGKPIFLSDSLHLFPNQYADWKLWTDTVLKASCQTSVRQGTDEEYRKLLEQMNDASAGLYGSSESRFVYKKAYAMGNLEHPASGEKAFIRREPLGIYDYIADTASFWRKEVESKNPKRDLYLAGPIQRIWRDGQPGIHFEFRDTGSSRTIYYTEILQADGLLLMRYMGDTLSGPGKMAIEIEKTLKGSGEADWTVCLKNKWPAMTEDLLSGDSLRAARARLSLKFIRFDSTAFPVLRDALNRLNTRDRYYVDTRTKLIAALGMTSNAPADKLASLLESEYLRVYDTVIFQQEIIRALARQHTLPSYRLLGKLLVEDPPVYDFENEYRNLFRIIDDSLNSAARLYPAILPLIGSQGMKRSMLTLLADLTDSGYVSHVMYKNDVDAILMDARLEWKKIRIKDERKTLIDINDPVKKQPRISLYNDQSSLPLYLRLLAPFYNSRPDIRDFFTRVLRTNDEALCFKLVDIMMNRGYAVPDSLITKLAANNQFRGSLWKLLERKGHSGLFPAGYRTQEKMAVSLLMSKNELEKIDSVALIGKHAVVHKGQPGWIYSFQCRRVSNGPWFIGFSGLQPEDLKKISADGKFVRVTDNRVRKNEPITVQVEKAFQKWWLSGYPAGQRFYRGNYFTEEFTISELQEQ